MDSQFSQWLSTVAGIKPVSSEGEATRPLA